MTTAVERLSAILLPPIPRLVDRQAREGADAIELAGADLRAEILMSCQDFTRRTGLTVKKLRIATNAEGEYVLGIRVRIKTVRGTA
jgi:hypothetical protein